MSEGMYLTVDEIKELGVDVADLNKLRRSMVLDETRMFVTVSTLRTVEKVAEEHGMVFTTQNRYGKIGKEGMLAMKPGTVMGPLHIHANYMVGNEE